MCTLTHFVQVHIKDEDKSTKKKKLADGWEKLSTSAAKSSQLIVIIIIVVVMRVTVNFFKNSVHTL